MESRIIKSSPWQTEMTFRGLQEWLGVFKTGLADFLTSSEEDHLHLVAIN